MAVAIAVLARKPVAVAVVFVREAAAVGAVFVSEPVAAAMGIVAAARRLNKRRPGNENVRLIISLRVLRGSKWNIDGASTVRFQFLLLSRLFQ